MDIRICMYVCICTYYIDIFFFGKARTDPGVAVPPINPFKSRIHFWVTQLEAQRPSQNQSNKEEEEEI